MQVLGESNDGRSVKIRAVFESGKWDLIEELESRIDYLSLWVMEQLSCKPKFEIDFWVNIDTAEITFDGADAY